MEARIAKLESDVGNLVKQTDRIDTRLTKVDDNVNRLQTDLAVLTTRVDHLPTKPWMFATLSGTIMIIIAAIGLLIRFIPPAT